MVSNVMKKTVSLLLTITIVFSVIAATPLQASAGRNWIYVDEDIEHGTVVVNNNYSGTINDPVRIRMTAVPDEGYDLKSWNVHYRDGANIPVQKDVGPNDYYFDLPQTNSKTKWIIIGAVFDKDIPHKVYVSWSDQSGMGSSMHIDRPDGTYIPGETVTAVIDVRPGASLYRPSVESSYYHDEGSDGYGTVFLEDFPDYTQIDENTFSFTMPKYDVHLSALFLEVISTVSSEKYFVEAGKTSGEMTEEEMAQYPCFDPVTFIRNAERDSWDYITLPTEVYAGRRISVHTHNRDNYQYCVTGVTAIYQKNGETIEQDIVDYETSPNEQRELTAILTSPGLDTVIRYRVEKLLFVRCTDSALGVVKPNISRALPGETVKLTVTPQQNYACTSLSVKDADGNDVALASDNSFVMPETDVTVSAVYGTGYVDRSWNGSEVVSEVKAIPENKYTDISTVSNNTLSGGNWYVVTGTKTFNSRLRVSGTANIVLCDGATLNANKGIEVGQSAVLNIYAQEAGTGKLYAQPEHNTSHASIGADSGNAGEINIYGGVIDANTESHGCGAGIGGGEGGAAGIIRIYGGEITALTYNGGAGIGGGKDGQASWHSGEGIIIYDGKIDVRTVGSGAGIGNGSNTDYSVGSIAIYGGEITAEGSGSSAGIGGGHKGRNGRIDIYGGMISAAATGSNYTGAGIGSGYAHQGAEINIHGGSIVAVSQSGAGIGAGRDRNAGVINISGGVIWANSSEGGAGIGGGCDGDGGTINISDGMVFATSAKFEYSPGALKDVLKAIGIKRYQNVNEAYGAAAGALILIAIGAAIDLIGSSDKSGAGIGGGDDGSGGTVNITGGVVMAKSSVFDANAIGHGGDDSDSGRLWIYDTAKVTAGTDNDVLHSSLQPKANRISACRDNRYVFIEPCDWHSQYTDMGDAGHKQICDYCVVENKGISPHNYQKNGACWRCGHQSFMLKVKKVWPEGVTPPNKVTVNVTSIYRNAQSFDTEEITLTLTPENDWTAEVPAIPGEHRLIFTESTVRNFLPDTWELADGGQCVTLPADAEAGVGSCVLDLINENHEVPDDAYESYLSILSSESRMLYLTNESANRIAVKVAWPENASESKVPESVNVRYSFGTRSGTAVLKRSSSWTSYVQIPADEQGTLSFEQEAFEYFSPVAWTLTGGESSVNITDYSDRACTQIAVGDDSSPNIRAALDADNTAVTLTVADSQHLPGKYAIRLADGIHGGTVMRSQETAYAGDVITLTYEPDHNYAFASFAVADENGQPIPLDGNTFEMPASDVIISAVFERVAYSITIRWSSVDGLDLMEPIVIDSVAWGESVRDAILDAGYTSANPVFEKEGYSDRRNNFLPEPITAYTSDYEMHYASIDRYMTVEDDVVLYYPMLKIINTVEVTVTPPVCGTSTSTEHPDAPWTDQTNPPVVAVPDGMPYQLDTAGDTLPAWWIVGATGATYTGSFTGGQARQFSVCLCHDFGYTFDADEEIIVNGGRLYRRSYPEQFVCEVIAVHKESENGVITREPTVTEPGEKTFFCVGCDLPMRTEPVYLELYSVNVDSDITGGTVTVSQDTACAGESISLTAVPNKGYRFVSFAVTDENDQGILLDGNTFEMPASDVTVTAVFEISDYQSVSIDDQIALNLLLNLDARGVGMDAVSIMLNGEAYAAEGTKVNGGDYDGLYKFKVVMAPAQIADEIVAAINGDEYPLETSVKAYCDYLNEHESVYSATEVALARAILNYGQAANDAFGYTSTTIADISGLTPTAVQNAPAVFSDGTNAVTGASFMALTKPEFRFYTAGIDEQTAYDYNQAGVFATMDCQKPDTLNARFVKKADKSILIEVTGVSAENMDKTITVTVTGLGDITFNGNAFAKAMASSNNAAQQNLGAALYTYGIAAKNVFGA